MRFPALQSSILAASLWLSANAHAVDVNAGDYTALPPGTSVAAWYQQHGRASSFNPRRRRHSV
ncbi:hypothetical protein [Pseudomonas syringae]